MLTKCQNEILAYTAAGLSAKEIADHSGRSIWTVQKIICNVKEKTGFQKATELVAYYFCQRFDLDFAEFKRQILSATMAILILFSEYSHKQEHVKFRHNKRTSVHVRLHRSRKRNEEFNVIYNV